jgi:hypothetical protein
MQSLRKEAFYLRRRRMGEKEKVSRPPSLPVG